MNKKVVLVLAIQSIVFALQIHAMETRENKKPNTQSMELLNNEGNVANEELYVIYLADAKAANTLNDISECGSVKNFKQALSAMHEEYEGVAPCEKLCCLDICAKKFNAEKTLKTHEDVCDLYEKIHQVGTIEETKQIWGIMGSYIFFKLHPDSNEDFTSLKDNKLVTWIKKFEEFNEPARKVPDCLDVFCLGFEHFKIFDFGTNHPKRGELKARHIKYGY